MADTQEKCSKYKKKDEGCPPASEFRSFFYLKRQMERGEGGKGERAATTETPEEVKKISKMAFKLVSFHDYIYEIGIKKFK